MRECGKCKSNEYTNKSLVMLINDCGHPLCRNCVDNLFARNAAPCHICGRMLRKNQFWEQTFDNAIIEKENHIRKRLRKIFNLREDDFSSLREYNDYLERVETLVLNLANGVDVEQAEKEIAEFQETRSEQIERNKKRLGPDEIWIQQQIKAERDMKARLNELHNQENSKTQDKLAVKDTKEIMKELRESNMAAEVILDRERKRQIEQEMVEKEEADRKKKLKKERKRTDGISFSWAPHRVAGKAHVHQPVVFEMNGPALVPFDEIETAGYLRFMREPSAHRRAGGFSAGLACFRAVLDARMELLMGIQVD